MTSEEAFRKITDFSLALPDEGAAGASKSDWLGLMGLARIGIDLCAADGDRERHISDLLTANNQLLERARKAEREVVKVRGMVGSLAVLLQKMIELKGDWSPPA